MARNRKTQKYPAHHRPATPRSTRVSSIDTLDELLALGPPLGEQLTATLTQQAVRQKPAKSPRHGEPSQRIMCSVIDGSDANQFFSFFASAVLPRGTHAFNYHFVTSYLGNIGKYRACVRIIKHRGDGFSFNIGGYIYVSLPGESKPQIRRFTGQYSVKSRTGHLYIYVNPCQVSSVGIDL